METDRDKWNKRFASQESYLGDRPSPSLQREIERIKQLVPGKLALDIACGEGRNSLFLREHGFQVTAVDISDIGLAKGKQRASELGLDINFRQADLDEYEIEGQYDLVLNFNFLLRQLIPQEVAALTPGGILLFDTILESPSLLQSHNPDYLLKCGELKQIFEEYDGEILFFEETDTGEMPTARLLFRKSDKGSTEEGNIEKGGART